MLLIRKGRIGDIQVIRIVRKTRSVARMRVPRVHLRRNLKGVGIGNINTNL
jgi:hypothetical protein